MSLSAAAVYAAAARQAQQQQQPSPLQTIASNVAANSFSMTTAAAAGGTTSGGRSASPASSSMDFDAATPESYTPTALGRWSVLNHKLPIVDAIKSIYVYDFDNTRKAPLSGTTGGGPFFLFLFFAS